MTLRTAGFWSRRRGGAFSRLGLLLACGALIGCGSSASPLSILDASGGSGGVDASAGAGGSGGLGGVDSGADSKDGGATCDCGSFAGYRSCCGDRCLNLKNDPLNCGTCGNRCPTDRPFCDGGTCVKPPCNRMSCNDGSCCGDSCCSAGQICCSVEGPLAGIIGCYTPTPEQPSCPQGCAPLCISDRNLKSAIEPVDPQEVLARLSRLPISRWRYLSDPGDVRHLGPMAQDFKQAFNLGDTDRAYYSVDAHGVSFAAIQALKQTAEQQQRQIDGLLREKRSLERRLRALESGGPTSDRGARGR
jgi:hypothetical protein